MKVFNIIACVIIFVLAAASAVFSYFLYEKRVQFVEGWGAMSSAIQSSAKTINRQSFDKNAGNKLTEAALSHKTYEKAAFEGTLKNLNKQSSDFVKQYENAIAGWDKMTQVIASDTENYAKRLKVVADEDLAVEKLKFTNVDPESFAAQIDKYSKLSKDFVSKYDKTVKDLKVMTDKFDDMERKYNSKVKDYNMLKERNDKISAALKDTTRKADYLANELGKIGKLSGAGADCDEGKDFAVNYGVRSETVTKSVEKVINNRGNIINGIAAIASSNGEKFDKAKMLLNPETALAPIRAAIEKQRVARNVFATNLSAIGGKLGVAFRDDYTKAVNRAASQKVVDASAAKVREAADLSKRLVVAGNVDRQNKETIRKHEATIAAQKADIAEYRKTLELDRIGGDIAVRNWARGSVQARSVVTGKVIKVSKEYGYIVIDFGTETTVIQKIGNKNIPVNPDLESGLSFNVVRNGEFIATVKLNEVDRKESTADIPPSKAGMIQVGDMVTFKK